MTGWVSEHLPVLLPNALFVATVSTCVWGSLVPSSQLWGKVISHGPVGEANRVALTFDDGPTPGATDRILDTLRDSKTPAAFFVVGANVRKSPELVKRMHDEGHIIGNHSFNHSHWGIYRGVKYWNREVDETNAEIEKVIGHRPALFRPPMGMKTWIVAGSARRAGLQMVNWSRRGVDGIATTPEKIVNRLGPHTTAGEIILLHDGVDPNSTRDPGPTVAAVGSVISAIRQRGLQLVRLDELIGVSPYQR